MQPKPLRNDEHTGVISTVILIVAALIILGYFHISMRAVATSPVVQDNLLFAWEIFSSMVMSLFVWLKQLVGLG
jgi:hypothetical protein